MFKLLILLVIVLGIIAVLQLAKVYELTTVLGKRREEDISYADNRMQSFLMLLFMVVLYISFIWLMIRYGDYLPPSASEHGAATDTLMAVNMWIIIIVFFIVNTLLFWFSYKYHYREDRKAHFFPHDNKLELIWTIVPTIVLAFIIIYGLRTWNEITDVASEDALVIEIYSKQFDWTARYSGDDGEFGEADFNLISGTNALGLITEETLEAKKLEIEETILSIENQLETEGDFMPPSKIDMNHDKINRLIRHKDRILSLRPKEANGTSSWEVGADDKLVKGEFHIPVRKEVEFVFNSRDVIHSAYMPHFRSQMNCVPGLPTRLKMIPTITTDSMRTIMDNPDFDYILLCNKVCGAAHFNMQMKIIVESEADYNRWLAEQKTFVPSAEPAESPAGDEATSDTEPSNEVDPENGTALLENNNQ